MITALRLITVLLLIPAALRLISTTLLLIPALCLITAALLIAALLVTALLISALLRVVLSSLVSALLRTIIVIRFLLVGTRRITGTAVTAFGIRHLGRMIRKIRFRFSRFCGFFSRAFGRKHFLSTFFGRAEIGWYDAARHNDFYQLAFSKFRKRFYTL
ncbi:hypothetical protein SDC9_60707 [bioreactor metagenome]|uniref:Uncharacterized protein n=1 Tax=bioreactor metagenome TaxID=1076179 RepID=A0A644XDS1_9ZZZZ